MKQFSPMKFLLRFTLVLVAIAFAFVPEIPRTVLSHPDVTLAGTPLVTIFARQIKENLYPDNAFYKNSVDDSMYVNGNKVNKPQAGDNPTVEVDPAVFPLEVEKSTETANEYEIHTHATRPTHIEDDEELEVNYDKRAHVLRKHNKTLETSIGDYMAYDWSPDAALAADCYVRTTGANGDSLAPGATGTRKKLTLAEFVALVNLMDKKDIPQEGRFGLIPAQMYNELLLIPEFVDYQKRGLTDLLGKGYVGEIMGIRLYKRSRAGVYTNATTPVLKAVGAATAATDNLAALFWHEDCVARAEGGVKVYINPDKAEYLGGLFSARVRAGGQKEYSDARGIVAVIQAHGA